MKEAWEVHLDASSALKIGGRFKNAAPVTLRAFGAFVFIFSLILKLVEWGGEFVKVSTSIKELPLDLGTLGEIS